MVVFINGAFGVGKTTVARKLRRRLPALILFDPEAAGYMLKRLPRWVPLAGRGTGDYQDMPLWRGAAVAGIRAARRVRGVVIVPMAFTNAGYLEDIRTRLAAVEPDVRHYCLTAPYGVVRARLSGRGADPAAPRDEWVFRRAEECCAAHARAEFAVQVGTEGRTVASIVEDLMSRLPVG